MPCQEAGIDRCRAIREAVVDDDFTRGLRHDLDETFLLYETIDHHSERWFIMCLEGLCPVDLEQLSLQGYVGFLFGWILRC